MSTPSANMHRVLVELEEALPLLRQRTVEEIFSTLESYRNVPKSDLDKSIDRNMSMAIDYLRAGQAPTPAQLAGAATTTTERFHSGVSIDQVIIAFRMSFSKIHEFFIDSTLGKLDANELVRGSQILNGVSDAFTVRAVSTFHQLQVESAIADASRRATALRSLLEGKFAVTDESRILPINFNQPYACIRASIPTKMNSEKVRSALEQSGGSPGSPAVVVIENDNDCIGIVSRRPKAPNGTIVGIGPWMPVSELSLSDQFASQAMRLAEKLGRSGVQGISELNWRLAAARSREVDSLFRKRFIDPVEQLGDFAPEMLSTLRAWLVNGRSIPRAAESEMVHVNTARYRLTRFSELTGFDPDNLDDLIGLAWILEMPPAPQEPGPL